MRDPRSPARLPVRGPSWAAAALAAASLAACGSSGVTSDASVLVDVPILVTDRPSTTADAGRPADAGAAATDAAIGTFQVQLVAATDAGAGYTSVVGRVQDGPTPAAIVWELAATDGDCRLLTPRVPFCATPCGGSAVCVENDTCRPYPAAQSVGTVRVTGVGSTPFDMISVANAYQTPGELTLPNPAFAEGDAIRVAAGGSAWASAFALETRGIAPLALAAGALQLQTGTAFALRWTAPTQTGQRVLVHLDISHHGGTRGKVECDTADDGELTIGAALVTRLMALGVAGYPTVVVTREALGAAALPAGRVELVVSSGVETPVTIPGLRSCTTDSDCDGGTCRADLTCG